MKWIVRYRTLFAFLGALLIFSVYWLLGYYFEGNDPSYLLIYTWSPLLPVVSGLLIGLNLVSPPKTNWLLIVLQFLAVCYLLRMAFLLLSMRLTGMVFPFYYTPSRSQGVSAVLAGLLLGYTIQCVLVRIRGGKDRGR